MATLAPTAEVLHYTVASKDWSQLQLRKDSTPSSAHYNIKSKVWAWEIRLNRLLTPVESLALFHTYQGYAQGTFTADEMLKFLMPISITILRIRTFERTP